MFLEVFVIPISDWPGTTDSAKIEVNRRLVELTGARIRPTQRSEEEYKDRAQIVFSNGDVIDTVGSYQELMIRIYDRKDPTMCMI